MSRENMRFIVSSPYNIYVRAQNEYRSGRDICYPVVPIKSLRGKKKLEKYRTIVFSVSSVFATMNTKKMRVSIRRVELGAGRRIKLKKNNWLASSILVTKVHGHLLTRKSLKTREMSPDHH